MADGSTKAIEKIKVGDKVVATDPESGETRIETVTAEIKGQGLKHLVKVTIDIDGKHGTKTAQVTATDGHPFWVAELGEWIKATDLKSGQRLRTSAGTYVQITTIKRWTVKQSAVNNLTVSDLHTYYVLAGATTALVHNCGGEMPDSFGKHDVTCECMGSGENITYESVADETSTNIANHANGEALRPDGDGTHYVRGVHPGRMAEYADGVINGNVPNVEPPEISVQAAGPTGIRTRARLSSSMEIAARCLRRRRDGSTLTN